MQRLAEQDFRAALPAQDLEPGAYESHDNLRRALVVGMLITSSGFMAVAWLAHLSLATQLTWIEATALAWTLALPEYAINIHALRTGIRHFRGAQMAAFRLASGVAFVALAQYVLLDEPLTPRKLLGFSLMAVSIFLIAGRRGASTRESSR